MYRKEVNAQSPLRILERSIHGGLGKGNLGVVMARAGVGKTAFLVQIGLDDLMREQDVLHVALGQTLEHVQSWYDGLFDDMARDTNLEDRDAVRSSVAKRRVIQAYAETHLKPQALEKAVGLYTQHLSINPGVILIDGYEWTDDLVRQAADLGAFKALARRLGAELWMTAQTHRSRSGTHPTRVPEPCAAYEGIIDVAVFLEPHDNLVSVRILKDHDNPDVDETHLELEPDTLQLVSDDKVVGPAAMPARAYTLLSGGANGAESEFGALAEEYGLSEINYSFAGRSTARARGVVELSEGELKQGEVSGAYVEAQLHRQFPKTPQFRKMLQTIWHQVNTAGQVFVVGMILPDNTVNGGTGWAAELAKHFGKPVHVYDQEKKGWFTWTGKEWKAEEQPKISRTRFTGTGTRFLSDEGKTAIRALFQASFGDAPVKNVG
jgi:KaiC/GvpD/RAD55 family RecA-like ATPase